MRLEIFCLEESARGLAHVASLRVSEVRTIGHQIPNPISIISTGSVANDTRIGTLAPIYSSVLIEVREGLFAKRALMAPLAQA